MKKKVRKQAGSRPRTGGKAKPAITRAAEATPVLPPAGPGDEDQSPSPFEIAGAARDKPTGAFDAWPVDHDADSSLDDAPEASRSRQRQ